MSVLQTISSYSKTKVKLLSDASQLLTGLGMAKLKINMKISEFVKQRVVFLGRVFNGHTKRTKKEFMQRTLHLVKPYYLHSLYVFLGLAGHFRNLKDFATKARGLTALTQREVSFCWCEDCKKVYQALITIIYLDPVLKIPYFNLLFELTTDSSDYGTGAILCRRDMSLPANRQLSLIGYYLYTFAKAQENYPTTEKEALTVLMMRRYFHLQLEGKQYKSYG